ncbi:hypothetical protein G6F57_015507 [Rhizopus arrhizus]|nr:hypothetical protein G6F57_015507 [Rhizopus arrhizus]
MQDAGQLQFAERAQACLDRPGRQPELASHVDQRCQRGAFERHRKAAAQAGQALMVPMKTGHHAHAGQAAFSGLGLQEPGHPPFDAQRRIERPLVQGARLLKQIRIQPHAGPQCQRLALRPARGRLQRHGDPVHRFLIVLRRGAVVHLPFRQRAARHGLNHPTLLAEGLVRIGGQADQHGIARRHEAHCAAGRQQLHQQLGAVGHDGGQRTPGVHRLPHLGRHSGQHARLRGRDDDAPLGFALGRVHLHAGQVAVQLRQLVLLAQAQVRQRGFPVGQVHGDADSVAQQGLQLVALLQQLGPLLVRLFGRQIALFHQIPITLGAVLGQFDPAALAGDLAVYRRQLRRQAANAGRQGVMLALLQQQCLLAGQAQAVFALSYLPADGFLRVAHTTPACGT